MMSFDMCAGLEDTVHVPASRNLTDEWLVGCLSHARWAGGGEMLVGCAVWKHARQVDSALSTCDLSACDGLVGSKGMAANTFPGWPHCDTVSYL